MKKKIIDLLKRAKIALANEEDATIEAALDQLAPVISTALQVTALENEKSRLTTDVTTLTGERDTAQTALANEKTALANEREQHAGTLLDLAITEGRIAASERTARLASFKTDFTAARTALANEKVKFSITSRTDAAERKEHAAVNDAAAHPSTKLVALANEALNKNQFSTFEDAYVGVKTTTEGQKIVAEMKAFDDARKGTAAK